MTDDLNTPAFAIRDDFGAPGASLTDGAPGKPGRRVVDVEGTVSLDNGAVRFAPPLRQGWGRSALAYGPFERRPGLALAVYLLNGHNTAQIENLPESLRARFNRWLRANEQEKPSARLAAWWRSGRVRRTLRMFRWWWFMRRTWRPLPPLDENLAVGWYPEAAPPDPVNAGNGFVMHATGAENGELWARAGGRATVAARAVPDIPLGLVVVLRAKGAAYYAAATPGCEGLPTYPRVRPVAIDTRGDDVKVYGVVTPAAYGQIGFRIDTRVYAVNVATPAALAAWCGTAIVADHLSGSGDLAASSAERSGAWQTAAGSFSRGPAGSRSNDRGGVALLTPPGRVGLVHAVVVPGSAVDAGLVVRAADGGSLVRFSVSADGCTLHEVGDGAEALLAEARGESFTGESELALQVALNGPRLECSINGRTLLTAVTARAAADGDAVGLFAGPGAVGTVFRDFEAHPDQLDLPAELAAPALLPMVGARPLITESFEGEPRPLEGKVTTCGTATWARHFGAGRTEITGDNEARVVATPAAPNPGRTAFTVPWASPNFAELEMEMTIPGTGVGEWQKPRGGFIFEQDAGNFLIVSLWRGDEYPGASVSSFFNIGGFEDIYDAVWSNIGKRAWYGDRVRLKVACDGAQYLVTLDGEPVLYRKLTDVYPDCPPLRISRVGIVANWEWGNDTGTRYRDFVARGLRGD